MNHFLKILDLSPNELIDLLKRSEFYRKERNEGRTHSQFLTGKNIGMFFEKPSLRTKVSFESAVASFGGNAIFIDGREVSGTRETIEDISNNLTRFVDGIFARVYSHDILVKMSKISTVPVINALCDEYHPMQTLADLQTLVWHFGDDFQRKVVTFIGDGCNVPSSLAEGCALLGMEFRIATPGGYEIPQIKWKAIEKTAKKNNGQVIATHSIESVLKGTDVLVTDTWVSMGQEKEKTKRLKDFSGYTVDSNMMGKINQNGIFMHCLPAYRGKEVSAEVIESAASKVFDEAECRMHTSKAVLDYFFNKS